MELSSRFPATWKSMKVDKSITSTRTSLLRAIAVIIGFSIFVYLLRLPLVYVFGSGGGTVKQIVIPETGTDGLKHFAGSRDCGISQTDIYHGPSPTSPNISPFCKNRATLLDALSSGGRHGYDEPYVGKGCTYRWFSTPEICMILERFNTIVFVGDGIAQAVYTALNALIREDLSLGGLQQSLLSEQDRARCKCEGQFLDVLGSDCLSYTIKNSEETKKNPNNDQRIAETFCGRVKHSYIPIDSTPASLVSTTLFKDLTYGKPNPWQPSPMILSFSRGANYDLLSATKAIDEWSSLAIGAERNIPMLLLGPPAFGLNRPTTALPREGNSVVWQFNNDIGRVAREKHFDMLSLFNLTVQASSIDGERYGQRVALVEAMMAINWLSKLATS